jgi:MoxR-like ATPase
MTESSSDSRVSSDAASVAEDPEIDLGATLADSVDATEFRRVFESYLKDFNYSSTSSQKYKLLEQKVAEFTGWDSVAMKYIGDSKNTKNRISESRNRPDKPLHAVIFVPAKLAGYAVDAATELVADGEFHAIAIAETDAEPTVIKHLVFDDRRVEPSPLHAAFPDMQSHAVKSRAVETPSNDGQSPSHGEIVKRGAYSLEACAEEIGIDSGAIQTWLTRLERKKHLVFQGPPGTGKTFVARRLGRLLAAQSGGLVDLVQLHPSYSYEDFVQGIRPEIVSGQITYSLKDGCFKDFCRLANDQRNEIFVLIIDEMNRGNLPRIFGELLFLLEYRDQPIRLSQGGPPFSIPSNVFIIGTMNTADRSIALVDHAIRRRFSFVFLGPNYDLLERHLRDAGLPVKELSNVLHRLNDAIGDKNYHIGTSFFLGAALKKRGDLRHIWEGEVQPYIEEYFFDQPSKIDEFRWEALAVRELAPWVNED